MTMKQKYPKIDAELLKDALDAHNGNFKEADIWIQQNLI